MDKLYVHILLIVVASTHTHLLKTKSALRVYNGIDDDTSKYPYVVALKSEGDIKYYVPRLCTGSLITEQWVITSAQCLIKTVKYIQYGNMSLPLNMTQSKSLVIKMVHHPRVIPAPSYKNNIGLMLVDPVVMAKYGNISAVDYGTLLGYSVEYAGFGTSFIPNRKTRNKNKMFKLDLMRPLQIGEAAVKFCNEPFSRNFICLSSKCSHKQLILPGDSGGPLFCGGKIIGIGCTFILEHYEQIFTPISPYLTWIHKVVTSES